MRHANSVYVYHIMFQVDNYFFNLAGSAVFLAIISWMANIFRKKNAFT